MTQTQEVVCFLLPRTSTCEALWEPLFGVLIQPYISLHTLALPSTRLPAGHQNQLKQSKPGVNRQKPLGILIESRQDLWLIYELTWLLTPAFFCQIADIFLNYPVCMFLSSLLLGKIKPQAYGLPLLKTEVSLGYCPPPRP